MSTALDVSKLYTYDLETFKAVFLFIGKFYGQPVEVYEISRRRNDRDKLLQRLNFLRTLDAYMMGYNNNFFDYPIVHSLINEPWTFDNIKAYRKGQELIKSSNQFDIIYHNDRVIKQIDLLKINHFDNANKRTRLKDLEFAMRSPNIEDLPSDPHADQMTDEEIDRLIYYGSHDVLETEKFGIICKPLIDMRFDLQSSGVVSGDVLNFSDVKLGSEYLINKIGRSKCFVKGSTPRQTPRSRIDFKDIIFPHIFYYTEEFASVMEWYKSKSFYVGQENEIHLEKRLAGIDFHFGVGGVHASVESKVFRSDNEFMILDVDVSGMYVAVPIANSLYPEHLGELFVTAYTGLKTDRARYKKGTSMNKVLKLAGNGVSGNSNNEYSCFYDPKYNKTVTVNGQLQILQLAEMFHHIPQSQLIQANTDGITCRFPRKHFDLVKLWLKVWEKETKLELELVEYSAMYIRDVNNYIAVSTQGKIKRKGAYNYPETLDDYEGFWNKDYSMMAVQKATSLCLTQGLNPEYAIRLISDPYDFCIRAKTPSGANMFLGDKLVPKTLRYFVSTNGQTLIKRSTPKGEIGDFKRKSGLTDEYYNTIKKQVTAGYWDERIHTKNRSRYEEVITTIESGWKVTDCNDIKNFNWKTLNYDYYVNEVNKLLIEEQ